MFKQTVQKLETIKRSLRLLLLVVLFGVMTIGGLGVFNRLPRVEAATNGTLNFQARLLNATGNVVADGYYNIEFKLYDVSSGGTALWTDTRYDQNGGTAGLDYRLRVKNGYVSVNLADTTAGGTAFPGTINWDQDLWLTMNIGGTTQTPTPTWDGEMTPRIKLTAVPYAFRAAKLAKLTGANTSTLDFATQTTANSILLPDFGGTLAIATGGTLTNNGVLYGNGTAAIQATAAGTTGQCLVATTSAAPSWGTCAGAGSGVTLQAAYENGNTITTTTGRDIEITLADVATDTTLEVTQAGTADAFRVNDDGTFTDTTPFVIGASGNVGVGVANPVYKLQVSGDYVYAAASDLTGNVFTLKNVSNTNQLQLASDGTNNIGIIQAAQPGIGYRNLVLQPGGGNVGIGTGTTAPAARLQVDAAANAYAAILNGNSTTGQSYGLHIQAGTNSSDIALRIRNQAGTADYVFVRGDGNVGIGTTAPSSILAFGGDVARTIQLEARTTNAAGSALSVVAGAAGTGATGFAGGQLNLTGGAATGTTGVAAGGDVRILGGAGINGGANGNVILAATAGNVGIGTTGPGAKLGFAADTTAAGGILFGTDTNLYRSAADILRTDDRFFINAPSTALSIRVGSETFDRFNISGNILNFGDGTVALDANLYRSTADILRTNDSLIVDGKLSVGTTNSIYKFDVADTNTSLSGTQRSMNFVPTYAPASDDGLGLYELAATFQPQWNTTFDKTAAGSFLGGIYLNPRILDTGATAVKGLDIHFQNLSTATVPYFRGVEVRTPSVGSGAITDNYGIYISDQKPSGVTTGHAIYMATGGVGNDINWAGDTNLYRSAADTLKTDDTLLVTGNVGIGETVPGAKLQVNGAASGIGLIVKANATTPGDLLQLQDSSGNINAAFNATGNQLTLGRIAASGTVTQGKLVLADGTTDNFGLTLQSATLTANRTYTLPNSSAATDTVCLLTLGNCSGSATTLQASYDADADGGDAIIALTATDGGILIRDASTPLTTAFAVQDNAGTGNLLSVASTGINLGVDTTVAAGKYLRLVGGNTASRPGSPTEGMVYYDTDTDKLLTYSNGKWQADRTVATKIVAASNSSQAAKDAADYIADGTGDQTEINAALTAVTTDLDLGAGTENTNGIVYLMEGTYVANATITIPNNTTLAGAGRGTLIELADLDATDNLIENSDTTTGKGVVIRDMRIDGRDDLNTAGTQYGIYFSAMGNGTGASARQGGQILNIWAEDFRNDAIRLDNSDNNTITGNTAQGNTNNGFSLDSSTNNTLTGNTAQGNSSDGFYIYVSSNNTLTGNTAQGNSTRGFYIYVSSNNNTLTGNTAQGNSSYGFEVFANDNNTITGNTAQGNSYGFLLWGGNNTTLTGNTAQGNSTRGFDLFQSNNNTIGSNRIHDNGGTTNNDGIYLSDSDSNTITDNAITDTSCGTGTTSCFAINVSGSSSATNYLADNRFSDTDADATATIQDLGTGTVYANQSRAVNGGQLTNRTADDTAAFQIQNAAGNSLFTIDSANSEIELGKAGASGIDGKLVIYNAANANTVTVTVGTTSASYNLVLPTAAGSANQCLANSATPGILTFANCDGGTGTGGAITLQDAYNASTSPATITTADGKNLRITLQDTTTDQTLEVTQAGTADAFRVNDDGTFTDTTPFVIDASGNVGIGTTGPSSKLDVTTNALGTTQTTSSGLALANTTAAAAGAQQISPALRWSGSGWKTDATAASQAVDFRSYVVPVQGAANPTGYLSFGSSINGAAYNDGQLVLTSDGNVGIGNTTPGTTRLLVGAGGAANETILIDSQERGSLLIYGDSEGNGSGTAVIQLLQDGGTNAAILGTIQTAGQDPYGAAYTDTLANATLLSTYVSNNALQLGTGNSVKVTIATTGNVGIDTTAPAQELHVYNTANNDSTIIIDAQGTGTSQQATLNLVSLGDGTKNLGNAATKGWQILTRGNGYTDVAGEANDFGFAYWNGTTWTDPFRIDSLTGNVGIGTTAPASQLHVVSASTSSTAGDTDGINFTVSDTGVVTTGTDVLDGFDLQITRTGATGGTIETKGIDLDVTGDTGGVSTVIGIDINVSGADTNYAALFNGGNVGIGTTTPTAQLHVSAASGTLFTVTDTTSTAVDVLTIADGGATTFKNQADSTAAFTVQKTGSGVELFQIDSTNSRVQIGDTTADATGVILVLDTKNTSGDPTGVNGAMYYNSSSNTFRCYENGAWTDCISRHTIILGSDVADSTDACTWTNITGLSFSVTSGVNYRFHANISYTSSNTGNGAGFAATGPTNTLFSYSQKSILSGGITGYDAGGTGNDAGGCSASTASSASTGNTAVLEGFILPTADGTLQLRVAAEASGATTTVKAGSTLEWW